MAGTAYIEPNPSPISDLELKTLSFFNVTPLITYADFTSDAAVKFVIQPYIDASDVIKSMWSIPQKSKVSDVYTMYKVKAENWEILWRDSRAIVDRDDYESRIAVYLKDDHMLWNSKMYDTRIELFSVLSLMSSFNLLVNNTCTLTGIRNKHIQYPRSAFILTDEQLGERNLIRLAEDLKNYDAREMFLVNDNSRYSRFPGMTAEFTLFNGDQPTSYESYYAPLDRMEAYLYYIGNNLINSFYMNVHELTNLVYRMSSDHYIADMAKLTDKIISNGPDYSQRIQRPMRSDINRKLYLTSLVLSEIARSNLMNASPKLVLRPSSIVLRDMYQTVGTTITANNASSALFSSIDLLVPSKFLIQWICALRNPSLFEFEVTDLANTSSTMSLNRIISAVISMELFPSMIISQESRVRLMNIIALYLVSYHWNANVVRPAPLNLYSSPASFFLNGINMFDIIVNQFGNFHQAAQNLITLITRNARPGQVNGFNVMDYVAFYKGWRPDFVEVNDSWVRLANELGIDSNLPIRLLTYQELMNYNPERMVALLDALIALFSDRTLRIAQPIEQNLANKYITFLKTSLSGMIQFYIIHNSMSLESTLSPYADSQKTADYVNFLRPKKLYYDLNTMPTLLLMFSQDVRVNRDFYPPNFGADAPLMDFSFMVGYFYGKVSDELGAFADNFTKTEKLEITMNLIEKFSPTNRELMSKFWPDSVSKNRFLNLMARRGIPRNLRMIIDNAEAINARMVSLFPQRGYRKHFYIGVNTHEFLPDIGLKAAFYTNLRTDKSYYTTIVNNLTAIEFMQSIRTMRSQHNWTNINMERSTLEEMIASITMINDPSIYIGNSITADKIIKLIKVDYPCILKTEIKTLTDKFHAPTVTALYPRLEEIYQSMLDHKPIFITGTLFMLSRNNSRMNIDGLKEFNVNFPTITTDLLPLPVSFLSTSEYMDSFAQPITVRKEQLAMNPVTSYGLTFSRLPSYVTR